ncbi:hypothetical protein [Flaviaesturariibacter amylovorans]|uniref:Uncharacterized protein n=1 Tax=Flaviaesturariibacter amylovorans TaxID=1084520 RepID=A0ABP8GX71_9BACT
MTTRNRGGAPEGGSGRHEHPLRQEIPASERERAEAAHEAAEHDIAEDADLSIHSPNDDLDEGETARLGEDKTDLV